MQAIELYRVLLHRAHEFLEQTMADVTPAELAWDPPGKAFSIAANYAHVVTTEDMGVQALLRATDLLAASTWAGRVGTSELPPLGPGADLKTWSRRATVDLAALRTYAGAVYAATDTYLASLTAEDLDRPIDLSRYGFGPQTAVFVLTGLLANVSLHTGEISCLKGTLGMQGYPV